MNLRTKEPMASPPLSSFVRGRLRHAFRARVLPLALAMIIGDMDLASAATWTVNSTRDFGDASPGDGSCFTGLFVEVSPGFFGPECTLRAAIMEANAFAGTDSIEFSSRLPTVAGVVEIFPTTALPAISDRVTIDGYSHPLYDVGSPTAKPIINIGGGSTPAGTEGLVLSTGSDDSSIRGLAIHGFPSHAIQVRGANLLTGPSGIIIEGCHLGISRGVFYVGNSGSGINLRFVSDFSIGMRCDVALCEGKRNVISNNGSTGIFIDEASGGSIEGNLIGTDTSGTTTFISGGGSTPNGVWGISVRDSTGIRIGSGLRSEGGNLVAGNELGGIQIGNAPTTIWSNKIGTNLAGTAALPNEGPGIELLDGGSIVGSTGPVQGNVVSGNAGVGIYSDGENTIRGNTIGLSLDHSTILGNESHGIDLRGSDALVEENVIAGNGLVNGVGTPGSGILVAGTRHRIRANTIGTNAARDDLGNGWSGIRVSGQNVEIGAPEMGNVIGHHPFGIFLEDTAQFNRIQGNWIGTDSSNADIPNMEGIEVRGDSNFIGGAVAEADPYEFANVIGRNEAQGVFLTADSRGNRLWGNYIGTNAINEDLGNGLGVLIRGNGNHVGAGVDSQLSPIEYANSIAFNGGAAGVQVDSGTGHSIRANEFFANDGGRAIDLGGDGSTPNDPGDGDVGENDLQNFPEFDLAQTVWNEASSQFEIRYRVDANVGDAAYPLTVDFYLNILPSGEADAYLGEDSYPATSATLNRSIAIQPPPGTPTAGMLVATATDADGNTSEFSTQAVPVPEAGSLAMLSTGLQALVVLWHRSRRSRGRAEPWG